MKQQENFVSYYIRSGPVMLCFATVCYAPNERKISNINICMYASMCVYYFGYEHVCVHACTDCQLSIRVGTRIHPFAIESKCSRQGGLLPALSCPALDYSAMDWTIV